MKSNIFYMHLNKYKRYKLQFISYIKFINISVIYNLQDIESNTCLYIKKKATYTLT